MNAMRISDVFKKRRRLLVPALLLSLAAAFVCTSHSVLTSAYIYAHGAANFSEKWVVQDLPEAVFSGVQRVVGGQSLAGTPVWSSLAFGAGLMGFLMFMQMRFYWWPIHSLGLLAANSWHTHNMWIPFLLGWMLKVGLMKLAGARALRKTRAFLIGVIVLEVFVTSASTVVKVLTQGDSPPF